MNKEGTEVMDLGATAGVALVGVSDAKESFQAPHAIWKATCFEAQPGFEEQYKAGVAHTDQMLAALEKHKFAKRKRWYARERARIMLVRANILAKYGRVKWVEENHNLVTTAGKNDLLDKYFAGSAYTAAWYCGLVSSVSFTAYAAGDTMSSHAGWTEAGATNAPNYSGSTRPALTFGAASGGSKATSSASSFTFSGAGTIRGMFACSNSTKDGTTGVLYNAVDFTGGSRTVAASDVVNVSVTYSA